MIHSGLCLGDCLPEPLMIITIPLTSFPSLKVSSGLTEQLKTCKQFTNGEYVPQISDSTQRIHHPHIPGDKTITPEPAGTVGS